MSKYGIATVVGGFGREMTPEESIPYTLARTYMEHGQLRELIKRFPPLRWNSAIEIGCGYGRNLPVLQETFRYVYGVERDDELRGIAQSLWPSTMLMNFSAGMFNDPKYDFILTFTFMQHLWGGDLKSAVALIEGISRAGTILMCCEETDPAVSDSTTTGRPVSEYEEMFSKFKLLGCFPRIVEATFPKPDSGSFMVFGRFE